jgi:hypothetical protein
MPISPCLVKDPRQRYASAQAFETEGGDLTAVQQVVTDGGGTDAFEFEVLFHPIAELTHGDLLGERGKKTKESSIGIVSNRASKTKRNQPRQKLPQPTKLRFGFVQQTEYFVFLGFFARRRAFPIQDRELFWGEGRGLDDVSTELSSLFELTGCKFP